MRNPLSKKIVTIQPSGIRNFFDIVSEMDDAISLGVGEPDFDTPWHIRDEGIYSLERGRTFYTSNAGLLELFKDNLIVLCVDFDSVLNSKVISSSKFDWQYYSAQFIDFSYDSCRFHKIKLLISQNSGFNPVS